MIRLVVAVEELNRQVLGGASGISGMLPGERLAAAQHSKQAAGAHETGLVHGSINPTLQFRKSLVFRVASRAPARLAMAASCPAACSSTPRSRLVDLGAWYRGRLVEPRWLVGRLTGLEGELNVAQRREAGADPPGCES